MTQVERRRFVIAKAVTCTDTDKEKIMTDQTTTAPTFRKKPVEVEAMQFDGTKESANQILAWLGSNGADAKRAHSTKPDLGLIISTLEGDMTASPGDWVIRGVKGEFYPCRADIFEATYEAVCDGPKVPGVAALAATGVTITGATPQASYYGAYVEAVERCRRLHGGFGAVSR